MRSIHLQQTAVEMFSQLPLIPQSAAADLLLHSESLPVYRARPDLSNQTISIGSSHGAGGGGAKNRKPVVAEIKSLTGASALQVNDELPSKSVAGRKGKALKLTSGSKLRTTKFTSYPGSKELVTPTVFESRQPLLSTEGDIHLQLPDVVSSRQSPPGNRIHSETSTQLYIRQEKIFLYEPEVQVTIHVPTIVNTDGASIETPGDILTKKHDALSSVASPIDIASTNNPRDHSSSASVDVIGINRPELVTSSISAHHVLTDVSDPALQKTQSSRAPNTSNNFTDNSSNSSNYSARTEYYEFASFSFGADAATNSTRVLPEMRGEISGRAFGMTSGDVASLSAGCALCLCVCLLLVAAFRYRKRSKAKRKKPVLDDIVNPSLLEEIIRGELARGRVKMYRTAITDTRELERLPLGVPATGSANDQWGTPTIPPAKPHGEPPGVPSSSSTRHSYRPLLFSDSPVRIYDLGQAKWSSSNADPDLVSVLRPWNTSHGDGSSRLSPVRTIEHLPLKTMSFPTALPVDVMHGSSHVTRPTLDGHVTRCNAPCTDPQNFPHSDCRPQSSQIAPFAPLSTPEVSKTTASGQSRCIPDGSIVNNNHHRKRFPKMGQSCLMNNRRSNCNSATASAASTNQNVTRSSVISTVMTTAICNNSGSTQHEMESKQNAGSLFVASGNQRQQMACEEFGQNEILWRNERKLLSHLRSSSPIYVNTTHLPTILSRDTAV